MSYFKKIEKAVKSNTFLKEKYFNSEIKFLYNIIAMLLPITIYFIYDMLAADVEYNYSLGGIVMLFIVSPFIIVNIMKLLYNKEKITKNTFDDDRIDTRKYHYVDMKKFSATFNLIGFILVFTLCTGIFSWKTYKTVYGDLGSSLSEEEMELEIPPTTQPPPPPPPPVTQIEVVEDEEIIEEEEIEEVEIDEEEEVEFEPMEEEVEEEEIFMIVEDQPEFPGGNAALFSWLGKNLRYPAQAVEMDIEGMVVVQFVINKKGEINDVKVIKPLGGGCDEEAVRIVNAMPKWKPGKQRGKSVSVRFNLPVRFVLR
tara:strand:+ start:655 stop:1590 length:936 start_codon:yes stop_codon:yes gene_type:complete